MFHVQPRRIDDWCIRVSGVFLCYLRWCAQSSGDTRSAAAAANTSMRTNTSQGCTHAHKQKELQVRTRRWDRRKSMHAPYGCGMVHCTRIRRSAARAPDQGRCWVQVVGSGCGPISWWNKLLDTSVCFCVLLLYSRFSPSLSLCRTHILC